MKISSLNLTLFLASALGMGISLFRTFPMSFVDIWMKTKWLAIAMVIVVGLAFWADGMKALSAGVNGTFQTTRNFLITIALLMVMIGFMGPVAKHFSHYVGPMLTGWFGYPIALLSSFLSVNSSMFNPIIQELWPAFPASRMVLLYLMTAIPQVSFSILGFRSIGLTDPHIIASMTWSSCLSALALMPMFWLWGKFFPL